MTETAPIRITAGDFVRGMHYQLCLMGWRSIRRGDRTQDGCDLCWNLSMLQAFVFLREHYDGQQLRFRIVLDWAHGTSVTLSSELDFMFTCRLLYQHLPGDGTMYFDFDADYAAHRLRESPIDLELLRELARRFEAEYGLPRSERTWPEGYEVPAEPFALAATRNR